MCILSGCDYLQSVKGVGLKTAATLLSKHGSTQSVINTLKKKLGKNMPSGDDCHPLSVTSSPAFSVALLMSQTDYVSDFLRARLTFLHQTVYDPQTASFKPLNPLPPALASLFAPAGTAAPKPAPAAAEASSDSSASSNKENAAPNGGASPITPLKPPRAVAGGHATTTADGAFVFKRATSSAVPASGTTSAAAPASGLSASSSTAAAAPSKPLLSVPPDEDKSIALSDAKLRDLDFLGPVLSNG
jgi:hypothetical protein